MFNRLRHIYSNFLNSERTVLGGLREWKVNRYGKAIVFVTQDGYRFWQYPGDPIKFNHQRRAVGDSVSVSKYASRFIAPGAVCIDIGSCIGSISVPLWSIIGSDGKLISIEADPDNIARLGANLRLNGYSDRWILNAAVTDADGTIQLRRFVGQNGWQTLGDPEFARDVRYEFVKVKAMRLDTIMADYGLAKVDFIKIDVEGAELEVLRGAEQVLRSYQPIVMVEVTRHHDEVARLLHEYGYQLSAHPEILTGGIKQNDVSGGKWFAPTKPSPRDTSWPRNIAQNATKPNRSCGSCVDRRSITLRCRNPCGNESSRCCPSQSNEVGLHSRIGWC